jgi:hypothetical protein
MQDPDLNRLVQAMDRAVEWAAASGQQEIELNEQIEIAILRLRCLSQRLGRQAEGSPYLNFIRRICAQPEAAPALAAGA